MPRADRHPVNLLEQTRDTIARVSELAVGTHEAHADPHTGTYATVASVSEASALFETIDTDDEGTFSVTLGTNWSIDADGRPSWTTTPTVASPLQASYALDANGLPTLTPL